MAACAALALPALGAAPRAGDYEAAPPLRASELLPPEVLKGPHHTVREQVTTDGFLRHFTIDSEYGTFEVRGEDALRERIREIGALAALRQASRSGAFGEAEAGAGEPGAGEGSLAGLLGEGALVLHAPEAGAAEGVLQPEAVRELLGLEATKRSIARSLGVDPYAPNPQLQAELERQARAVYARRRAAASGAARPAPPAPAPPEAMAQPGAGSGKAVPPAEASDATADAEGERVERMLREYSAEDLERLNRIELAAMGVPAPQREEFLHNPHYTPGEETRLVAALAELEGTQDRASFVEVALGADSSEAAESFEHVAELIRRYGRERGGIARMLVLGGRVAAQTADGHVVVPVVADHALWTAQVARFAEGIAHAAGAQPQVGSARLLFTGTLSPRARRELEGLGLAVTEDAFEPPGGDAGGAPAPERR